MRQVLRSYIIIGMCLFLIPIVMVYGSGRAQTDLLKKVNAYVQDGQVEKIGTSFLDEEKLIPILAKEINYTYGAEAIKAQAVIVRTYMARKALGIQTEKEFTGYTEEEMRALWKESYDSIYNTYKEAIDSTVNEIIVYNGEPIQALYHNSSSGYTRSASDVYEVSVPYLLGVESPGDIVKTQVKLSKKDIVSKLRELYDSLVVDEENLQSQIQIIERDEAGYIKHIQIGNVLMKGEELRNILKLPSSCFKIFTSEDALIFDVEGNGHGVGLSQIGANELAEEGKDYKEILAHYYTDIDIVQCEV